jgi:AraC-like DNA-binding protein
MYKRLRKEYNAFSLVSMECGFSSRVYFQRLFKERTGLTPAEWRRQR